MRVMITGAILLAGFAISTASHAEDRKCNVRIEPQPLKLAMIELSGQCPSDHVYRSDDVENIIAPRVECYCSAREAMILLTKGTGRKPVRVGRDLLVIAKPLVPERHNQGPALQFATASDSPASMPEVLVNGLNAQTERTREDSLAALVMSSEDLASSGAKNLDQALSAQFGTPANSSAGDPLSAVLRNVRVYDPIGLGADRTRVLVNGRRLVPGYIGGKVLQLGAWAIPLKATQRVEVVSGALSGTYGPDSTGSVINILTRNDPSGLEASLDIEQPTGTRSGERIGSIREGFRLGNDSTLTAFMSWDERDMLLARDRHYTAHGIAKILANNPNFANELPIAPNGQQVNIRSASGRGLCGPGTPAYATIAPGYTFKDLSTLCENVGAYSFAEPNSSQPGGSNVALLSAYKQYSGSATLNTLWTDSVSSFFTVLAGRNVGVSTLNAADWLTGARISQSARNNPTGMDLLVTVPAPDADGSMKTAISLVQATTGFTVAMPANWTAAAETTWGQSGTRLTGLRSDSGAFAVSNGTLDVLQDFSVRPLDVTSLLGWYRTSVLRAGLQNTGLRAGGPVWNRFWLSGGFEHLSEYAGDGDGIEFKSSGLHAPLVPASRFGRQDRATNSAYLEARLPFDTGRNTSRCAKEFELVGSARLDDSHTNVMQSRFDYGADAPGRYRSSLRAFDYNASACSHFRALTLRGAWGTGYRLPPIDALIPLEQVGHLPAGLFTDARRGGTDIPAFVQMAGGNPQLEAEKATSWSVGFVLAPEEALPGFRFSVDFKRINQRHNIVSPSISSSADLAAAETLFPGSVVRGPVPENDPFGVGPIVALDTRYRNASRQFVDVFTGDLSYRHWFPWVGDLKLHLQGTVEPRLEVQIADGAEPVNRVGHTALAPLERRFVGDLSVTNYGVTTGWRTRFLDSYMGTADEEMQMNQGGPMVPHQIYHDVFVRYGTRLAAEDMKIEAELGVQNVFNTRPAFDSNSGGRLYYSQLGDPRRATYYLGLRMSFGPGSQVRD